MPADESTAARRRAARTGDRLSPAPAEPGPEAAADAGASGRVAGASAGSTASAGAGLSGRPADPSAAAGPPGEPGTPGRVRDPRKAAVRPGRAGEPGTPGLRETASRPGGVREPDMPGGLRRLRKAASRPGEPGPPGGAQELREPASRRGGAAEPGTPARTRDPGTPARTRDPGTPARRPAPPAHGPRPSSGDLRDRAVALAVRARAWGPSPLPALAGVPAGAEPSHPAAGSSARAHRLAGLALRSDTAGTRGGSPSRGAGPRTPAARRPPRGGGPRRLYERARRAWDRPLTAYYVILGSALLITVLGLVMVYSASMIKALSLSLPSSYFFRKQFLAAVIGTGLLLLASRIPSRLHRALAYPLLLTTVFLMVLVQIPGIGESVGGNQNWLQLGAGFQLQPSEFGKLALVLWGADLLARKQDRRLLAQWKHMLVPLVPVAFMLLGLIMLGGDMGTAIILTAILFGLLWLAGAPTRLFAGVLSIAALVGFMLIRTSENRMSRLMCIGAIDLGPKGECWQAVHGIYALASGGWFGSGLGASVEKWGQLPEAHTDFIFAIAGEELGLAGTLSVLALFAALGYAGIRVAGRTEDPFVRYAAGGVTTWIMAQATVNIGAVLGLLPIAGVPLPLFSYGGSALLPSMFAIGLLIAFAREDPAAKAALAMRRPGVRWKTMRRRVKKRPSGER